MLLLDAFFEILTLGSSTSQLQAHQEVNIKWENVTPHQHPINTHLIHLSEELSFCQINGCYDIAYVNYENVNQKF